MGDLQHFFSERARQARLQLDDGTKSEIYLECVPLFTRGLVRLPDHPKLLRELRCLHLQRHSGGRESVDHPRGDHDDHANSCCGVLRSLSDHFGYDESYRAFQPNFVDEDIAQPAPAQQPEPPGAGADWWRGRQQVPATSSADQQLNAYYRAIAAGFLWGPRQP